MNIFSDDWYALKVTKGSGKTLNIPKKQWISILFILMKCNEIKNQNRKFLNGLFLSAKKNSKWQDFQKYFWGA